MSLTQTQINEVFAALGLPVPSSAILNTLQSVGDDNAALNTIIQLPQVQISDIPIVAMFDLALDHAPTASTLSSMVESDLSQVQLASAFVSSQAFANVYNGGLLLDPNTIVGPSNEEIITALFLNGLGHSPSPTTLNGFFGLTLAQAFLAFTQSQAVGVSSTIDSSILNILELATGIPASVNPPPTQTLTLTVGQDTVASGATYHDPVLGAVTVLSTGSVTIDAPLAGVFGNQPTLTPADSVSLTGTGNVLNATFAGALGGTVTGLNLVGLQTWNIQQTAFGTISLSGGPTNFLQGVTAINYNGNGFANSLLVGTGAFPILPTTGGTFNNFALTVANAPGFAGNGADLAMSSTGFTGTETIDVTANTVGTNGVPYDIAAGSPTKGFAIWNVMSTGAAAAGMVNNFALGGAGSMSATTLNVADDGSSTIIWASFASGSGGAADWANLATIDDTGTGNLTITGGEVGSKGLLADDATALTSVTLGTGANLVDLSGYAGTQSQVAGLSIAGGGNTTSTNFLGNAGTGIEFNNAEINLISEVASGAFKAYGGVADLYDVGTGVAGDVGGAINLADFPGATLVSLLDSTSGSFPNQDVALVVTNAPDGLTFDFNAAFEHDEDFSIQGSDTTGGAANSVTIDYGPTGNGGAIDSTGTFLSQNFDFVNVNVGGSFGASFVTPDVPFYSGGIVAEANTDTLEALTIDATETYFARPHGPFESITLEVGNISTGKLGFDSITLLGGELTGPTSSDTGTLDITGTDNVTIGVTNASTVTSTISGVFDMISPDDVNAPGNVSSFAAQIGDVVSSTSADSILQGTLGSVSQTGNDTLTDTVGGSFFFGDGGADIINLGGGSNDMLFGEYLLNDGSHRLNITNGSDEASQGFWGVSNSATAPSGAAITASTSADMTTVGTDASAFVMQGVGHDTLTFNADAWAGGSDTNGGLVNGEGFSFANGTAATQLVGAEDTVNFATNLVLYTVSGLTDAADLAAALEDADAIKFAAGNAVNAENHMLFAYAANGDIHIADVDFVNGLSGGTSTAGQTIFASDIVDIVGGNSGVTSSLPILGINAADVQFVHV